jgi:hypothetical protein
VLLARLARLARLALLPCALSLFLLPPPPVFQPFTSRDTLLAAAIAYQGMYGNADGSIPVT